jgi:hypothetical protein
VKRIDDAYDTGIGTQFSAETNKRDEDEEMWVLLSVTMIQHVPNVQLSDLFLFVIINVYLDSG